MALSDAARADAEMPVEPLVLGRDHGVVQIGRHGVGGDLAAEGLAPPGEDLAVAVQHGDRSARATVEQVGHRRQLRVEVQDDRRQGSAPPIAATAPGDAPDHPPDRKDKPHDQPMLPPWPAGRVAARSAFGGAGFFGPPPDVRPRCAAEYRLSATRGRRPVSCCHACSALVPAAAFPAVWPHHSPVSAKCEVSATYDSHSSSA